ncbi:MAG: quinone oxidoreductase [Rhodospirillales bacterium]|nr:MAG: quinone oxidoreductase [Rhodospirillales bacterium]
MVKAVRIHEAGGPEKMVFEDVEVGDPGPGEARIRHTAIGLNYIDVYTRSGLYPTPLPNAIGREGAGVVVSVGKGVKGLKKGDRVAYCGSPPGAYAEERVLPAAILVKVPAGISDAEAAAMMLKGMTTEYLIRRTFKCKKGDVVLFHAAAGGVGLLFGQWAKALGVKAVGTVSTADKAALAKKNGYAHVIVGYDKKTVVDTIMKLTKGKGVPVVYDGVGKDTWDTSLACLAPRGLMVSFGNASGPVPPVSPAVLGGNASLFLTRPSLGAYTSTRADLESSAKALFAMVKSKKVKIRIDQRYDLKNAAQAHRDLESRKTTGQTVLVP